MQDELISEYEFAALSNPHQEVLISRYCADFKERINRTSSWEEAVQTADQQCFAFDAQCSSSVVRSALRDHVQHIIDERWKK